MDGENKENASENEVVIFGHRACQTRNAKWMCLENIFQKFHRPNFYDIGGTYIQDIPDFWFMYKTEQVGGIYLLHLFISNRQEGSFSVGVSCSNDLKINKKDEKVYLSTSLKEFHFRKPKEITQLYLYTYSFSDLDVDILKNKKLYIAVSFPVYYNTSINKEIIDNVKVKHDFSDLMADPIGSDFTIESADGQKFKVHKVLLSTHSEVFKAMLKEDTAESQNSYVKLVDVASEDLECILEFIYTGTIKNLANCNFINLLVLADQYNLIGLRELSQYALAQQLSIENAIEVLMIADMYNSDVLKAATLKFIKKNPAVFQTSPYKEMNSNPELVRELCQYVVTLQ